MNKATTARVIALAADRSGIPAGHVLDQSRYERIELGHIALCIDAGHWIEP